LREQISAVKKKVRVQQSGFATGWSLSLTDVISQHDSDVVAQRRRLSMTEFEKIDQRICEYQKKFDDAQSQLKSKHDKFEELEDNLVLLKREAELIKANEEESPYAQVRLKARAKRAYPFT
jgi:hypothetical protein